MQSVTKRSYRNSKIYLKRAFLPFLMQFLLSHAGLGQQTVISQNKPANGFCLFNSSIATPIYIDQHDHKGVLIAVNNLKTDIAKVSGTTPPTSLNDLTKADELIIIGTIGKNDLIDKLIASKKLDVSATKGQWESYQIQTIENPLPTIKRALIVTGSDKRGTIFGVYELSKQIGISPWHWWADVPPKKYQSLYFNADTTIFDKPVVKYRGIFLNDEEPALGRWAVENYGGFNHLFYEKLFELMLRLKSNYLWPAMWWASFNSDDQLNPKLADEYGIIMGTTHHEPMMRAHSEWKKVQGGEWNYETNEAKLANFWKEGIKRMGSYESIITLAMRGDGDKEMTAETNTALLERIVSDQRKIITEVTGKKPEEVPQLWALYKEVQDYYDKGMRVPDDVLLLLCDDNWGNIRKLPKLSDSKRQGGYGIYYHFDYVGGPRNYKWLNTNPLPRIWEQMNLAYQYGADKLWLVNVGDLKPMELPTEFFLDFAWNPNRIKSNDLTEYSINWASEQFGKDYAQEIAGLLNQYTKFNARRKPELLTSDTYSLLNYREAETIISDYNALLRSAERLYKVLSINYQAAYYELVLHPISACANLNALYLMQAKNKYFARQSRTSTNLYADSVKLLFQKDSAISHYYNKELLDGKWNHMMDQTHISYTYWQQPEKDLMPAIVRIDLKDKSSFGVAVENSDHWWPQDKQLALPTFDAYNNQKHYIEIFKRGQQNLHVTIKTSVPWLKVNSTEVSVDKDVRLFVEVDWSLTPKNKSEAWIYITSNKEKISIKAIIDNSRIATPGFIESNGYVSIESSHYSRAINSPVISWTTLMEHGKTNSAITTTPVTAPSQAPDKNNARVEYLINTETVGESTLYTYFSPSIDFHNEGGLKFAVSIDDEAPQTINLQADKSNAAWEKSVSDNIITCKTKHILKQAGQHTIKYWAVDSGVVLQKLVLDLGGLKPSYLGPPESFNNIKLN